MTSAAKLTAVGVTTGSLALASAHALPAVWFVPWLRRVLRPRLAGIGRAGGIALTFDDGPHPVATPAVLRVLRQHDVHATFFVLGEQLARHPDVGRRIVDGGHELAVHGWDHGCLTFKGPARTRRELARAVDVVADIAGVVPRWWRPPYGVATTPALRAGSALGLTPVLWTSWGRDWERRATPRRVLRTVAGGLYDGGTILLHDSDVAAVPNCWTSMVAALPDVLALCARHGWRVGTVSAHDIGSPDLGAHDIAAN